MPSTSAAGAVGEGGLDALVGGVVGMLPGSFVFAQLCPRLERFLKLGSLGERTLWQALGVNPWAVVLPVCSAIIALLLWIEATGL